MITLSKNLIKRLYFKKSLSTIEISKRLGISEWVVLGFMRRNNIPRRSFLEAYQVFFKKKQLTFSIKKNLSLKKERLKMVGVFLYWGEGVKLRGKNCCVDFANSNPEMIKIFMKFLRQVCGISEKKLRVFMYCYSDQGIENLMKFWHNVTNIPLNQFTKPYVKKSFKENSKKMEYGLVHIRYADKKLLIQIENWIKEYSKFFEN